MSCGRVFITSCFSYLVPLSQQNVAGIKYSKVHFWIVCNIFVTSDCLRILFFPQCHKTAKDAVTNICRCLSFELASWQQASWVLSPIMTLMGALLSHQLIRVSLLQVH